MKRLINLLLVLTLIFASAFSVALPTWAAEGGYTDLIISEYIEGSSYNKALEIYNGTGVTVDLSQYTIVNFTNGASQDPTVGNANAISLNGTLASGDVYVIANSDSDQAILDVADNTGKTNFYGFNGDDSLILFKDYDPSTRQGIVVDSIGKVGEDPGSYWGTSDIKTQDMTLLRKQSVLVGDTDINDVYDPSAEWIPQYKDTFSYLGSYPDDIVVEEPKEEYISTVESVVDGDTIHLTAPVLGATKVRYVNIDTPETYHLDTYDINLINSDPDHSQKYHGEKAKEYLNTLLKPGDEVIVKVGEEPTDAYGRLLAQVIRKSDNLNTNLEMVKQGYAVSYFIWPIGDEVTYNKYQNAVKSASDSKLGIWSEENTLMELPFVFRARDEGKGLLRYVGNSESKIYVQPKDWATVPVEKRIFFSESEAIAAGYTAGFEREPIIAEARYAPLGSEVTVEGIVTYIDGINHYIQDDTAGIIVRSYSLNAEIGDKISATGITSNFHDMLQIVTEDASVIEEGVGVPDPKYISADKIGEELEGQLVAIEYVDIQSVNKYNEYTSNDINGNIFTIDSDDRLVEVGKTYDTIIGVINYSYGSYRIIPRFPEDIIEDIPVISIAEARNLDIGTKVQIEGIITATDGYGTINYYVQDETAGIVVRVKGFNGQIGDKIRAKARTEEYFGLLEIIPELQNVSIVEVGVGTPKPKLITSSDVGEDLEGQLVKVKFVEINTVDNYGNYGVSDENGSFVIDNDDKDLEVGKIYESITGVLTYNYDEYKVMPRFINDIVELDYFTNYINEEESLSSVSDKIVKSAYSLGLGKVETLLNDQLISVIKTKGNTEQHIESTVHHIIKSLSKLETGNYEVEIKKIEHEIESLFKKNI